MQATESPEVLPVGAAAAPWARRPTETSRMFSAFASYRNLPPTVRSLAKVAEELGVSSTYVERLSRQHRWVERATAFDDEQDVQRRGRLLAHREEAEKHYLRVSSTALEKISQRLEDLDPADIRVSDVPRLLSAILEIQQMLLPPPTETRQPGLMTATQIRLQLRAEDLLSTRQRDFPPSVSPRVEAWNQRRPPLARVTA